MLIIVRWRLSPTSNPPKDHLVHPSLPLRSSLIAIGIPERDRYQQLPDLLLAEPLPKDKDCLQILQHTLFYDPTVVTLLRHFLDLIYCEDDHIC